MSQRKPHEDDTSFLQRCGESKPARHVQRNWWKYAIGVVMAGALTTLGERTASSVWDTVKSNREAVAKIPALEQRINTIEINRSGTNQWQAIRELRDQVKELQDWKTDVQRRHPGL